MALVQRVENSSDRPAILSNLSQVYQAQGDLAGAQQLQEEAVAASEQLLGPGHPWTGLAHNNLANLYLRKGELALAETHGRKAVAVLEAAVGPAHRWVASSCDTLAGILARQGRLTEAQKYAQRALKLREEALGSDDPMLSAPLDKLGYVYLEMGDARLALPLLERALSLHIIEPAQLADVRFHTARALLESGKDKRRARQLAAQALEGYRALGLKDDTVKVERWLKAFVP